MNTSIICFGIGVFVGGLFVTFVPTKEERNRRKNI